MKLSELIEQLQEIADDLGDKDPEVRLAIQPRWAFEHNIADIQVVGGGFGESDEDNEDDPEEEPVVYLGEGSQIGYLPGAASRALGWH